MPKHVCGAWLDGAGDRTAMRGLGIKFMMAGRCNATAVKTRRGRLALPGAWWPVDRPEIPQGKARIAIAGRAQWAAFRAAKAVANSPTVPC